MNTDAKIFRALHPFLTETEIQEFEKNPIINAPMQNIENKVSAQIEGINAVQANFNRSATSIPLNNHKEISTSHIPIRIPTKSVFDAVPNNGNIKLI